MQPKCVRWRGPMLDVGPLMSFGKTMQRTMVGSVQPLWNPDVTLRWKSMEWTYADLHRRSEPLRGVSWSMKARWKH